MNKKIKYAIFAISVITMVCIEGLIVRRCGITSKWYESLSDFEYVLSIIVSMIVFALNYLIITFIGNKLFKNGF